MGVYKLYNFCTNSIIINFFINSEMYSDITQPWGLGLYTIHYILHHTIQRVFKNYKNQFYKLYKLAKSFHMKLYKTIYKLSCKKYMNEHLTQLTLIY